MRGEKPHGASLCGTFFISIVFYSGWMKAAANITMQNSTLESYNHTIFNCMASIYMWLNTGLNVNTYESSCECLLRSKSNTHYKVTQRLYTQSFKHAVVAAGDAGSGAGVVATAYKRLPVFTIKALNKLEVMETLKRGISYSVIKPRIYDL